jgi:hypothetical protein
MIPIKAFGQYIVTFEAEPEETSMRHHFRSECGWSHARFQGIKGYAWFSAKVSIYLNGSCLASDYLGQCCYETEAEFYTKYEGDDFSDMVRTCAEEIGDPKLLEQAMAYHEAFRRKNDPHQCNLDIAQREMDSRAAQGEDMSNKTINQVTYEIQEKS